MYARPRAALRAQRITSTQLTIKLGGPWSGGDVGSSSQADYLLRNSAMDDSIGGS
jgi:hypothetical protein